jgi:hypothetical protein
MCQDSAGRRKVNARYIRGPPQVDGGVNLAEL